MMIEIRNEKVLRWFGYVPLVPNSGRAMVGMSISMWFERLVNRLRTGR